MYVVGCPADGCHNVKGSQRAAKRIEAVKQALAELAVEPERVAMYHLPRGLHPEFIDVARQMNERIRRLGPDSFWIDAAVPLAEVNEALDLELEEGEYDTLAGLVLDRLERIPRPGEVLRENGVRIEVVAAEAHRIQALRLMVQAGESSPREGVR